MPTYNISGFPYSTPKELNDQELSDLVTRLDKAGVLDPKAREQEFQGREDLKANPELLNSYKQYYKRTNGQDFSGTPDELVDSYMNQMRYWNINTGSLGMLAARLKDNYFSEEDKQSIALMWDAWDRTVPFYKQKEDKWKALGDFAQAALTDPTNLASVFSMGSSTAAGVAAREATRGAVKQMIKNYALQGVKNGAITGAGWSAADSVLQQNVKTDIGRQNGFSVGQLAQDTAIGAGAGSLLGGALGAAQGLNRSRMNKAVEVGTKDAPQPKLESNMEGDLKAGEEFAKAYSDPNVVGEEARKQARDNFLSSISEDMSQNFGGNIGKKVSFEEAKQRSGELLDRLGVTDYQDIGQVANKLTTAFESGKIQPSDLSTLTATSIGMENRLLRLAQEAHLYDSEHTAAIFKQWQEVAGLSSHLSSEVARSTAYQANRYRDLFDGVATQAEFYDKVAQIADPVMARTYLQLFSDKAAKWGKLGIGAVNEFWVHNILGSLSTIASNVAGGTSRLIVDPLKMLGGGILNGDLKMAKASAAQFAMEAASLKQATKYAWDAFKTSAPRLDNRVFNEQVERNRDIVIGNRDYDLNANFGSGEIWKDTDSVATNLANMAGNLNRFIGKRMMVASDELVKQISFRSSALRIAYLEHLESGSKNPWKAAMADVDQAVEDQLHASSTGTAVNNDLAKRALNEARSTAFQDDMGTGDIIGRVGNTIQKAVNTHPVFTQIVPFVRTPFRIMEYWAAHAPVLQHFTESFQQKLNGNPRDAAEAQAMVHMGTLFAASAMVAATTLDIEGDGPTNKGQQGVRQGRGITRNSVELNKDTGLSIGINKLDPIGRYYTLAAKVKDIYKFGTKDEQDAAFAAVAFAFAKNFAEMGSLAGVNQIFQASQSPDALTKYAGDKLGSMIPYFRLLGDINEEDYKVANTFIERIYKGLPVANENMDRKRDPIFGEEIKKPNVAFYASPIPTSYRNKDDVDKELVRLGASFSAPDHNIRGIDLRTEKHPNGRSAYDRLQELAGIVQDGDGKTLYENLRAITKDPNYQEDLTDPESRVGYTEQGGRLALFEKALRNQRKVALDQLKVEMPDLAKRIDATNILHRGSKTYEGKVLAKELLGQ